MSQEKHNTTLK